MHEKVENFSKEMKTEITEMKYSNKDEECHQ